MSGRPLKRRLRIGTEHGRSPVRVVEQSRKHGEHAATALQTRRGNPRQEAGGAGHRFHRHDDGQRGPLRAGCCCRNVAATSARGCSCASANSLDWLITSARRIMAGLVPGYFAFYTGTEPAKAAQVETELLKEAELLRTEGLTAEELKRAKAKIIGQKKIARQDLGSLASTHGARRTLRPRLAARGTRRREIRSRHAGTGQSRRAKIS